MNNSDLLMKLEYVKSKIIEREWKYYHIASIENFIFHINKIKNQRSKERTWHEIDNYLEAVAILAKEDMEVHMKSKELFPAIFKLSEIYKFDAGFIKKPNLFITMILFGITYLIARLSLTNINALILSISLFLVYGIYAFIKIKERKYFF